MMPLLLPLSLAFGQLHDRFPFDICKAFVLGDKIMFKKRENLPLMIRLKLTSEETSNSTVEAGVLLRSPFNTIAIP